MNQSLVIQAHEEVSKRYFNELKQELGNIIDTKADTLDRVIEALAEKSTPFDRQTLVEQLAKDTSVTRDEVERVIDGLYQSGVFERLRENTSRYRCGRLFKQALRMKYNRETQDFEAPGT